MAAGFSPERCCRGELPCLRFSRENGAQTLPCFQGENHFSPLTNAGGIIPATELLAQTVRRTKKYRSKRYGCGRFVSLPSQTLAFSLGFAPGTENLGHHGGARSWLHDSGGCRLLPRAPRTQGTLPLATPQPPNPTNSVPPRAWRRLGKAAGAAAPSHCLQTKMASYQPRPPPRAAAPSLQTAASASAASPPELRGAEGNPKENPTAKSPDVHLYFVLAATHARFYLRR